MTGLLQTYIHLLFFTDDRNTEKLNIKIDQCKMSVQKVIRDSREPKCGCEGIFDVLEWWKSTIGRLIMYLQGKIVLFA